MPDELLPGLYVWSAIHEGIGRRVYSAYFEPSGTLIDPMLPQGGPSELEALRAPERIVLTNRHHYRHSGELAERFGCPVLCHEAGLHEFEDGRAVSGFPFGDVLGDGVVALELGSITPEEATLHLDSGPGVLALGDGLRRNGDGSLGFMRDSLLGDDPEAVKAGLRRQLSRFLEREFDAIVLAHGEPLLRGARTAISSLLAAETATQR